MALKLFQSGLKNWYKMHQRTLPWRGEKDPYKIWLSEVILQQTRVDQGMAYYLNFVETFPTVEHLANAQEEEVLKLWQGLGYYSRARNLHFASKQILEKGFPSNAKDLLQLKGVGEYTAAAISSIAFNEAVAAVDGNVFRVLSRYFGVQDPIDTSSGKKEFQDLANKVLDKKHSGNWNQAVMEFGALQCVPTNPNCHTCPVSEGCYAFKKELQSSLPFKRGKIKQIPTYIHYFFLTDEQNTILMQRSKTGIWGGLYEFPSVETPNQTSLNEALELLPTNVQSLIKSGIIQDESKRFKHLLSHRNINCWFHRILVPNVRKSNINSKSIVPIEKLEEFPISRLMEKYLDQL